MSTSLICHTAHSSTRRHVPRVHVHPGCDELHEAPPAALRRLRNVLSCEVQRRPLVRVQRVWVRAGGEEEVDAALVADVDREMERRPTVLRSEWRERFVSWMPLWRGAVDD